MLSDREAESFIEAVGKAKDRLASKYADFFTDPARYACVMKDARKQLKVNKEKVKAQTNWDYNYEHGLIVDWNWSYIRIYYEIKVFKL